MKNYRRGRCPSCAGSGEVEFTMEFLVAGTNVLLEARRILTEEADAAGLVVGDIVGPSREKRFVGPRFRAAKRMFDELGITKETIGQVLGGRHHSTIIYQLRRANGATWKEAHSAKRDFKTNDASVAQ